MKTKTTIIKNKAGVSAVIGIVLMVAIVIAIACTVYVYISGFESNYDIIKSKIEVSQNYTVIDISFKDVWNVRHIDRVEIIIMDFDNASIITIKGFLYNRNTNQLSYDNNSELIKLKEI